MAVIRNNIRDAGMEEQFLSWIQEHGNRLQRICYFYSWNSEERKDLYQEVLIQIWKSMPRFREESSPGTWMYRIAVNTALMHRRTMGRKKEVVGLDHVEEQIQAPTIESSMDQEQRMQWLKSAIKDLKDLDKTILLLYFEEIPYDQIATITGISVSNVGVRLTRIRKQLSVMINSPKS
ncbi:MAG: RNA polymerase sigma factor [Bacteroidia bacterium]|nr:RNA polymerase sigma factor [Bacteroidia bacterium]